MTQYDIGARRNIGNGARIVPAPLPGCWGGSAAGARDRSRIHRVVERGEI